MRSIGLRYRVGVLVAIGAAACGSAGSALLPAASAIPLGSWGGDSAGLVVGDTAMHLHIACTFGDVPGRVAVDPSGRFDVAGTYVLRAYPILVGPTLPARFAGRLVGDVVTLSVTVDDTTQHKQVVRGPVTVRLGDPARLGPCPICRRPIITKRR